MTPTPDQQAKLDQPASEFPSTRVREDDECAAVYVDCFEVSSPERCVVCGLDDTEHFGPVLWPPVLDHSFRVAVPVATFRIAPSGFVQNLTPSERTAA